MLLLIDIGNTRIKWAIPVHTSQYVLNERQVSWARLGHVAHLDVLQLRDMWLGLSVTDVIISNVARQDVYDQVCHVLTQVFGETVNIQRFVSQAHCAGVVNHYQYPDKLGSDRFAALIGVKQLFNQQHVLLATCGTATTVDTLTKEGHFVGGVIVPGLDTMARSLANSTAQLPKIDSITNSITAAANNTIDGIVSGCINAQIGVLMQIYEQQKLTYGQLTCVLAGGAASLLSPFIKIPHTIIDHPVLTGLYISHFIKA